jgi:hypothetical protein
VITFGSTGDGMLPVSFQEQVVPVTFCIGLWSHAQKTFLLRNKSRQVHYPKNENKTHGLQEEIIYVHKPKLTDFYKVLGERKLPP